jgi:hypothetical protein
MDHRRAQSACTQSGSIRSAMRHGRINEGGERGSAGQYELQAGTDGQGLRRATAAAAALLRGGCSAV